MFEMEHTNLLYYATQNALEGDYPDGKVDSPIPGVAYAHDQKTVLFNKKKTSYEVEVSYEDRSGNTLASSTTVNTPEVLEGNTAKVIIYPVEVEDANPVSPAQKITVSADTEFTFLYYVLTSYTVTVNHKYSGETIASSTTIVVEDVYEEDVVSVTIEPLDVEGYVGEAVTILVSGDCEYNLQYVEISGCYVDLGLPSGTLWACNNLGAENPEDLGYRFSWAETEAKESFNSNIYYDDVNSAWTKYNDSDQLTSLELTDDAAHVHMGGNWHIPTLLQTYELIENTTRTTYSSYVVFTSNINGNSVTFPICGQSYLFWFL